jgi:hypothetical protein
MKSLSKNFVNDIYHQDIMIPDHAIVWAFIVVDSEEVFDYLD